MIDQPELVPSTRRSADGCRPTAAGGSIMYRAGFALWLVVSLWIVCASIPAAWGADATSGTSQSDPANSNRAQSDVGNDGAAKDSAAKDDIAKDRAVKAATAKDSAAEERGAKKAGSEDDVAEDDGKVRDITFDDIKFEMEKGTPFERTMLTEKIEKLAGKKIKIRGYMLPSFQQKGIRQFVLVRDNMECCFGPGAALYDCIIIEMAAGKSTQFTVRPIAVEGQFKVKELLGPDGKHLAIYEMVGESVK